MRPKYIFAETKKLSRSVDSQAASRYFVFPQGGHHKKANVPRTTWALHWPQSNSTSVMRIRQGTSRSMVGTRHARRASQCLEINKDGSSPLRLCEPRHYAKPVTALARSARRFRESWASCMRRTPVSPWAAACPASSVNTFVRSSSACRRSLPGCRPKRTGPIRPADVTSQLPPWLPSVRAKTGLRAHFDACC